VEEGKTHRWESFLERDDEHVLRIKAHDGMLADALLVSDEEHWSKQSDDRSPKQLTNTAHLPGIVGDAWAMADWHFGYGFPIGGVVATDLDWGDEGGVISPGGVGFDINCGVRMVTLDIAVGDIPDLKSLARRLAAAIPAGASGKGGVQLNDSDLSAIAMEGAGAAVEMGWGYDDDLARIESNGVLETIEGAVSERARKRGMKALGTLGSGNHFLEIQVVDRIVDSEAANSYGLREGQIVVMIHTGSRGFGHQVCSDFVQELESGYRQTATGWMNSQWGIEIPDRQLAAAPFYSKQGQAYFDAMQTAANYAFANRSTICQRLRNVLKKELGRDGEARLLYDVAHNIAKVENHVIHGKSCNCCVHRKGATRALGGDNPELAGEFSGVGQPVLIPGDMGTASWVLAGPKSGENRAFSSSCHGAGRALSRTAARKLVDSDQLMAELQHKGIIVHAKTPNILSEESPAAYKDVDEVIKLTAGAGLARPVARLRPLIVVKG